MLEELMAADEALNDAYGTLKKAAPNARDYYLGGPSDFTLATTQHMDRLKRLDSVINEIREIIIDVDAQG